MKSKLIVLAVVVIVLIVAAGALIGGGFKSDLVDVTSCTISEGYGDTPFGGHVDTAIIKFSIMPKETINRVDRKSVV